MGQEARRVLTGWHSIAGEWQGPWEHSQAPESSPRGPIRRAAWTDVCRTRQVGAELAEETGAWVQQGSQSRPVASAASPDLPREQKMCRLVPSQIRWTTLGKWPHILKPQFPLMQNGDLKKQTRRSEL